MSKLAEYQLASYEGFADLLRSGRADARDISYYVMFQAKPCLEMAVGDAAAKLLPLLQEAASEAIRLHANT